MPAAFEYQASRHIRRHGPTGYSDYGSFRPWLRDEFTFRCVYCLDREQWGRVRAMFDLDHFTPQCISPTRREDYDNLVYSCHACNLTKGDQDCPDPTHVLTSNDVIVHDDDGTIEPKTDNANRLIRILDLDDDECRRWRLMMMRIIELAKARDPELYKELMGFPIELPDLSQLRPKENKRADGVGQCYFARRARGELPETY